MIAAIVAAGVALSVLGWVVTYRLDGAEQIAAQASTETVRAERSEALADHRADMVTDQRDALAALVVYRCDTGTITDPQVCDAARGIWPRR